VTIDLSVSSYANAGGAISITSFVEKISLKEDKAKTYILKFLYPASLANGNYYLIASVNTGAQHDLNLQNNTTASASAVDIAAAFIDLSGSNLTLSPFKTGKPAQVNFDITNNGNIPAKGVISVQYLASTDQTLADGIVLMTVPGLSLNLKNGSTKPAHQKLTIPTTLPAGTYYLLAVLDSGNTLGDINTTNNLLISANTFSAL
jgi:hypothetical protein